jgi:hypothetical protein
VEIVEGAKAWANISSAHLGRIKLKTSLTVHLDQMVARHLRRIKTLPCRSLPVNPSPFHSFARPKTHESMRQLWRWRRPRVCSATSVLPEGERAAIEPSHGDALRQILWVAKNYSSPRNPSSRSPTSTRRWIRAWLRSKVAPRGDLDIEQCNTAVVRSFRWRSQSTRL